MSRCRGSDTFLGGTGRLRSIADTLHPFGQVIQGPIDFIIKIEAADWAVSINPLTRFDA